MSQDIIGFGVISSVKIGVLKNFAKLTGKHLCQDVFFKKVSGLRTTPNDCFCNL